MAILTFRDEAGRLCKVPWPPEDLGQVEAMYHECGCSCAACARLEGQMVVLKHSDEIVDRRGGFVHRYTVGELVKKQAGDRLHKFALAHMQRHPGVGYPEAFEVAKRLNPELVRQYAQYEG